MNMLDRLIAWADPVRGAKRLSYRTRLLLQERGYDAAKRDHRTSTWHAGGTSANAEIGQAEEVVRNRVRDLLRNNGYALQIIQTIADHVVGTGIIGAPVGLKGRNQARVTKLWNDWQHVCDFDGDHDLSGLMWSAVRGMAESGAAIIRFRRQAFDASTALPPIRLQLLEPDFIDPLKNGTTEGGGIIDRGIEYDADGRKVALWLLEAHPGDVTQFRSRRLVSHRVPMDELIYLYDKLRPGQDRGMPVLAPAVMTLFDLDGYFDAELVRKKIESCLAGFITTDSDDGLPLDENRPAASAGAPQVERFSPGMITRLKHGENITIATPANSQGVSEFAMMHLREASAAAGVMVEHATGDFSHVNYSSWRAGNHGFRRRMERLQWHVAIHKMCRPIGDRFIEAARAAGQIPSAEFGFRWTPPGFISVDPKKDSDADLNNVRLGKRTLPQLVEAEGYDFVEHLTEYAESLKLIDEILGSGTMFDGDPRKSKPGTAQTGSENNAAPAA